MVVAEEFVDTATGTGLVHLSPANGEEDFLVATRRKRPGLRAHRRQGQVHRGCGAVRRDVRQGRGQRSSRSSSARAGTWSTTGRLEHEYPTCWRSGHRLVWVARREYFYWIDRIKDDLVAAAEKVEYYFDQPRNRFIEFIKQSPPWCISRERVWGTPLPIWVCADCKEKVPAFSRGEHRRPGGRAPRREGVRAPPALDRQDRPEVPQVRRRVPAGSPSSSTPGTTAAPRRSRPSPTRRGRSSSRWSTSPRGSTRPGAGRTPSSSSTSSIEEKPVAPYRAFLFQGHVLDEKGRKMSKSLGNVVDALEMLSERLGRPPPVLHHRGRARRSTRVSLDLKEMTGRPYQILNTLYHLHVYLSRTGSRTGSTRQCTTSPGPSERSSSRIMDRWLLTSIDDAVE